MSDAFIDITIGVVYVDGASLDAVSSAWFICLSDKTASVESYRFFYSIKQNFQYLDPMTQIWDSGICMR